MDVNATDSPPIPRPPRQRPKRLRLDARSAEAKALGRLRAAVLADYPRRLTAVGRILLDSLLAELRLVERLDEESTAETLVLERRPILALSSGTGAGPERASLTVCRIDGYTLPMAKVPEAKDGHVKTTVLLPEALWRAAKIRAVEERRDLRGLIVVALEAYLAKSKGGASR